MAVTHMPPVLSVVEDSTQVLPVAELHLDTSFPHPHVVTLEQSTEFL